ncbi:MAG: LysR substrate-binding domain-containing protein [Betaproteobacteria bacterium]
MHCWPCRWPPRHAINGLDEKELLEESVALMTRREHPLAKKITWSDLQPYPWVLPAAASLLRDPLERILERHGVTRSNNYIETLSTHLPRSDRQTPCRITRSRCCDGRKTPL